MTAVATSSLRVFHDYDADAKILDTTDGKVIAAELHGVGVRFERWAAGARLPSGAEQDEVIAAYRSSIDRLMNEGGYKSVDVIRLERGNPNAPAMRAKFLDEHAHSEDEVRFFVEGRGAFYLHVEQRVYQVVCVRGDLISVPKGTKHWFDMGADPEFTAIRIFTNQDGWVAQFTGDDIAARFPQADALILKAQAALFDIEGTVGSISFVHDVLFPYARERMDAFVAAHKEEPPLRAVLDMAARDAGADVHDLPAILAALHEWTDRDVKITPLKELQGMIWQGGFESGEIRAPLYDDAVDAMQRYRDAGVRLAIYSSGSIAAQKLLFGHTTRGDLRAWIDGYFDTTDGPKKSAASYERIAARIGIAPGDVVFFSDVAAELDAARETGMQTVQLARPQDGVSAAGTHPSTHSFADITVER